MAYSAGGTKAWIPGWSCRAGASRNGAAPASAWKAIAGAGVGLLPLLIFLAPAQAATVRGGPSAQEDPAPEPYLKDCASCHGPAGEGTNRGPTLQGVGAASADFNLRTGRMPLDSPDEQPRRGQPAYGPGEIDEMVDYIAGLGDGPPIPSVDPGRGDLALGAELYRDNCAACHSVTGSGGVLDRGNIAPTLIGSAPLEVAEAMRIGGDGTFTGNMPVFEPPTFGDHEVDSIVSYVEYLQEPRHEGGAPLGRLGPVGEGMVALGIATPVLLLFMFWAGSRK